MDGQVPHHISTRTRFHKVCLGADDKIIDGRQFMSWNSLNKLTGHNGTIDLLKIDIEGWEYDALPWIVNAPNAPVEIVMELHSGVLHVERINSYSKYTIDVMKTFSQRLNLFRSLYSAGYYILAVTGNKGWRGAAEYSFARLRCANNITIPSKSMSNSDVINNIIRMRISYMNQIPDNCKLSYCEEKRVGYRTT